MDLRRFAALGAHVAERLDATADGEPEGEVRRQALAGLAGQRAVRNGPVRARLLPALAGFGLALALVLVLAALRRGGESAALSFSTGSPPQPGSLGQWIAAARGGLSFSDGSRVALDAGGRALVARMGPHGAEIVLEGARAHAEIVPRPGNDWRLRAGPFVVEVKGTRFDVFWNPASDTFTLDLYQGRVVVSGCSFGAGRVIVAGEHARASCGQSALEISRAPGAAPEPPVKPPALRDAHATPPAAARPERPVPPASGEAAPDWTTLARSGRYERAYALLLEAGVARECRVRGAEDLLLLADAARLSGHSDDARLAYSTLRERFAGGAAAARAAFELGRLEADRGRVSGAATWFETYLGEQPAGPLAPAALGRLLEANVDLGSTERARELAETYVKRYPSGPHADAARKVLGLDHGRSAR